GHGGRPPGRSARRACLAGSLRIRGLALAAGSGRQPVVSEHALVSADPVGMVEGCIRANGPGTHRAAAVKKGFQSCGSLFRNVHVDWPPLTAKMLDVTCA